MRKGVIAATVAGGLTGGLGDFTYACVTSGLPPLVIGRVVARGWFGKPAMHGGTDVALIGVASHFAIVLIAAALYVAASLRLPVLRRHAWIMGPLFGLAVFGVMRFAVLPLSKVGYNMPKGLPLVGELASHLFLVGLPIGLFARALVSDTQRVTTAARSA